jgi:ketosteroid isomerase-like protein
MAQESVAVVTQALEAFNRRDLQALRELNDPDIEVDWTASRGVEAGIYRGINDVLRFYASGFDVFETIVLEPDRLIEAGESVVVPNRGRSRGREGIEVFTHSALVFTVRAGKITRICLYQETQQALEAVGLPQ